MKILISNLFKWWFTRQCHKHIKSAREDTTKLYNLQKYQSHVYDNILNIIERPEDGLDQERLDRIAADAKLVIFLIQAMKRKKIKSSGSTVLSIVKS
mgnify:CR=1 FL=1